jgi:hypothetical protein
MAQRSWFCNPHRIMVELRPTALAVACCAAVMLTFPGFVHAQAAPPPPPPSSQASQDEDDARVKPAEPDFALVNLPTSLVLPRQRGNFRLTHRFLGNLRQGSFTDNFSNLFGIDNGAVIGLEFRYAPVRRLQVVFFRSSQDKTIQFSGSYNWLYQDGFLPVGVTPFVSIEGTNNFKGTFAEGDSHEHDHPGSEAHRSPAFGAVLSRTVGDRLALYVVPTWVGHTLATDDGHRNTWFVGLGARARILQRTYVVGEVTPRTNGYVAGDAEYAFGIEKRVGGHMFLLTFTNSFASTNGQLARGGAPGAIYMGFNIGRKFF